MCIHVLIHPEPPELLKSRRPRRSPIHNHKNVGVNAGYLDDDEAIRPRRSATTRA